MTTGGPMLTVPEVAARLRCSPNAVLRRLRDGRLPGVRPVHAWLIRPADVDAYLAQSAPAPVRELPRRKRRAA